MEHWKPILGFEGSYEVSDLGRVRSVSRTVATGKGTREVPPHILSLQKYTNGYITVSLGGKKKHALVHRLVAEAFISPAPFDRTEVNHINRIKSDNRAVNLEWVNRSGNMQHAHDTGAFNHDLWRKKVRCSETGEVFSSSYTAAEWVNAEKFSYKGVVEHIASNIRTSIRLNRRAYGYKWFHVEKQPSTTIPKGSTPKRVEMGSSS